MYSLNEARRVLGGVDLVEGLPLEEIHTRLEIGVRLGDTGQGILAFYLAEMADLGTHQVTGHRTASQYAEDHLGIDRRRAGELIAAGRKLRELPIIHAAFCEQRIGWSKVLLLLQVVVPEHQEAWLARAETLSCRQLRRDVALSKAGAAPRDPKDFRGIRDPRFPVRARLDSLTHEAYRNAKRKLSDERGAPVTDAEFLDIAARLVLGSDVDGTTPGRKRVDHSLYQIVLHGVEPDDDPDGEPDPVLLVDTELGRIPIDGGDDGDTLSKARAEAIRCDAECSHAEGDAIDAKTPAPMRKRVLHRDDHRCRCCGSGRGLEAHHIEFRADGGRTRMWNLLSLCNGCHSLVHARLLLLAGKTQKKVRFVDAEGRLLARAREYASPEALHRLAHPQRILPPTASSGPEATTLANVPAVVDTTWWQRHLDLIRSRDGKRLELSDGRPRADAACRPDAAEAAAPMPVESAFDGLIGQDGVTRELAAAAQGSRRRGLPFPHTLFVGPAGTGKTTLARGVAALTGARLVTANGPLVQDTTSLLALLTQLGDGDVLFLDEVHAVPRSVLEVLYEAMADGALSLTLHRGLEARPVRLDLPPFTVLAATTAEDELEEALISRFATRVSLGLYATDDLAAIVTAHAGRAGHPIEAEAARLIADRARGTPRSARRLLERVLNDVLGHGGDRLDLPDVRTALLRLGYDDEGLDPDERRYRDVLRRRGGPVSLGQLARDLGLAERTVRNRIEPSLLRRGLVEITARGRRMRWPPPGSKRAERPADLHQALLYVRGSRPWRFA